MKPALRDCDRELIRKLFRYTFTEVANARPTDQPEMFLRAGALAMRIKEPDCFKATLRLYRRHSRLRLPRLWDDKGEMLPFNELELREEAFGRGFDDFETGGSFFDLFFLDPGLQAPEGDDIEGSCQDLCELLESERLESRLVTAS